MVNCTIAGWTCVSGPKPRLENGVCENIVYPAGAKKPFVLNMKNGLPYLSRELFWLAMNDVARNAKRISGHTLDELQEMLDTMAHEPQPQIYSVQDSCGSRTIQRWSLPQCLTTLDFRPNDVRRDIIAWFDHFHPTPNLE